MAAPETAPAATDKALALLRELRATTMDVDRAGNLWTWDAHADQVQLYGPDGASLAAVRIPGAIAVDVDWEWGVASLIADGFELRIVPFDPGAPLSLRIPNVAYEVAWIDAQTVAVAPALAGHRVEIWNLRERTVVREMGSEKPLEPKPGVTVIRAVDLDYDPQRRLLYTTESFTGDVQIFSLDGKLVRRESLPRPDRQALEKSLAETDVEARKRNDVQMPAIWWFHQAVDANGTVWLVQDCDRKNGKATFFKIPLQGKPETMTLDEPCCHRSLALWGDWLVLYADPAMPRELCNSVRKFP